MPTPRKRFYTVHEISAQECARVSAGQYCRYPGYIVTPNQYCDANMYLTKY